MKKQVFRLDSDGFNGAWYPAPGGSSRGIIVMLGDSSEDHMAMQKLRATLIRKGTCCTGACCDYCIVGDQNPLAAEYELKAAGNGLLVSVRKER